MKFLFRDETIFSIPSVVHLLSISCNSTTFCSISRFKTLQYRCKLSTLMSFYLNFIFSSAIRILLLLHTLLDLQSYWNTQMNTLGGFCYEGNTSLLHRELSVICVRKFLNCFRLKNWNLKHSRNILCGYQWG